MLIVIKQTFSLLSCVLIDAGVLCPAWLLLERDNKMIESIIAFVKGDQMNVA